MKHRYLIAGLVCCLLVFNASAQLSPPVQKQLPEKLLLFGNLPERFQVSNTAIEKLFTSPDSGNVEIQITSNYLFKGVITEKIQNNPHVITINIKSSNYNGALLSLSKITYNDLSTKYLGRIISIHYGDVYELATEDNAMFFIKKKQSVVITE